MDVCPFCKAKTLSTSAIFVDPKTLKPKKKVTCSSCEFEGSILPENILDAIALKGAVITG